MTKLVIVREGNNNLLCKIPGEKKITEYERTKDESKQLSSIDIL